MPRAKPGDQPAGTTATPIPTPPQQPLSETLPGLSEDTDWLAVGYYGPIGSGKTTNLSAMAKLGRMILVNEESGAKIRALRRQNIPTENIRVWPNHDKGEQLDYNGFEALYFKLKADLMRDPTAWIGIGMDSITEIVRILISSERKIQYQRAIAKGKDRQRFFTDRDDYQTVTAQVGELLRMFRHLPCHFAFSALQRRDDDGWYGPSANPGIANDLPGFVDLLVHCELQDLDDDGPEVFTGWVHNHAKYLAKDRYGWLPKAIPDPQFDRLFEYVRETLTPNADPALLAVKARREAKAGAVAEAAADS